MDREGIDVSIVFRTRGAHLVGVDGLEPDLSAGGLPSLQQLASPISARPTARV